MVSRKRGFLSFCLAQQRGIPETPKIYERVLPDQITGKTKNFDLVFKTGARKNKATNRKNKMRSSVTDSQHAYNCLKISFCYLCEATS